jgi:Uri superfamily endonuclease
VQGDKRCQTSAEKHVHRLQQAKLTNKHRRWHSNYLNVGSLMGLTWVLLVAKKFFKKAVKTLSRQGEQDA